MPGMVRAAAYIRSSPFEASVPELSASAQRARLEQHAAERGWELARVYEDEASMARPRQLPGLGALLADADEIDRLVVVRLDRIARSPARAVEVLQRLEGAGCELVCVDHRIDTGGESGRLVRDVLESLTPPGSVPWAGGWSASVIRRHRIRPATVIDVGAAGGTPALYEAFPDAYHVMIEPLDEFEEPLQAVLEKVRGEYVPSAVGAEQGVTNLNVVPGTLVTSSMLRDARDTPPKTAPREVPLTTLDALLRERRWAGPFCLKLDVEGYEHAVIEGAPELLAQTELVISETSITERHEGALNSAGLIALMAERGFAVADVIDAHRSNAGLLVADLAFKPARDAYSS
jgi:FkbM family methyltransferase